jgi:MFS family permease
MIRHPLGHLLGFPFLSVFVQVGLSSAFPQLRDLYQSDILAGTALAAAPLAALLIGPFWGVPIRRFGERPVIAAAAALATLSMLAQAAFLPSPAAMITSRFFFGLADSALVAAILVSGSKAGLSPAAERTYFSLFETFASSGAIAGPLLLGSAFVFAPRLTLAVSGALFGVYLAGSFSRLRSFPPAPPHMRRKVSPRLIAPTAFAVAMLSVLVAFEVYVPSFVEAQTANPVLGKLVVTVFEGLVVLGTVLKARIPGLPLAVPLLCFAAIGIAYLVSASLPLLALLAGVTAVGLGLSLSLGNEYASAVTAGYEESGMTVYSAFKISGNFFGPYIPAIGFPVLLLPLSALALVATGLVALKDKMIKQEDSA